MPLTQLEVSQERTIADLLRRVSALENRQDPSKQTAPNLGSDDWEIVDDALQPIQALVDSGVIQALFVELTVAGPVGADIFFDSLGAGDSGEGFIDARGDDDGGFVHLVAQSNLSGDHVAEVDLQTDVTGGTGEFPGNAYVYVGGDWITFNPANGGGTTFGVAPDLAIQEGGFSVGYDGDSTIIFKAQAAGGGGIKTATVTLT